MKNILLIINYNDAETTKVLIDNVRDYEVLDGIVILDNKSSDDSYDELRKLETSKIKVIQSEANKGYAYAINFGSNYIRRVFGDSHVIVSNSDIVIYQEDDIQHLIHTHEQTNAGITAPIVREHEGLSKGWKNPTPLQDAILNIVYIHRFLKPKFLYYKDSYYENKKHVPVEVILGCFFIIDTNTLEQVDGFDEHTFLYYEENIMAKKLEQISKQTYIDCEVEIFHNHSVSINKSVSRLRKYTTLKDSQYYFQTKYNHANAFERFLLKLTAKCSYLIFSIAYRVK